jgi:general transcription factor 3C polypeptide 3 (transcription factor C subunit 4)
VREKLLPDEVRHLLGVANVDYINKNFQSATEALKKVIQISPTVHQAWFTLGMIHDEMQEPNKAMHLYLVAAHLTPKDADLWRKLAVTSL